MPPAPKAQQAAPSKTAAVPSKKGEVQPTTSSSTVQHSRESKQPNSKDSKETQPSKQSKEGKEAKQSKVVQDLGPLDVWSLRDHLKSSQKIANGGMRLIDIFKAMDLDRSGSLSKDEFTAALKKFGYVAAKDEEIAAVLAVVDADNSGTVVYKEMSTLLLKLGPRPEPEPEPEPEPPPPPPKPPRDRFPKWIDPDAQFAQPTHAQVSALKAWKRSEHGGSRASSPREALTSDEDGPTPAGSLAIMLSRRGKRPTPPAAVLRDDSQPAESFRRTRRPSKEEMLEAKPGGGEDSQRSHDDLSSPARLVFKPSVEQGTLPFYKSRQIMMNAGHNYGGVAAATYRTEVPVRRGERGFGVVIAPNNIILDLAPGGTAEDDRKLQVGDAVLGVDGHLLLDGEQFKDWYPKLPKRSVHLFIIQRQRDQFAPGGFAKATISVASSRSSSPMQERDHLVQAGPDLAQISVRSAAVSRYQPLELRHVRERLVQQYARRTSPMRRGAHTAR